MSKPRHTPGPWHVSDMTLHGCRLVYAPDGRMVADAGRIHRRTDDEMDANARLIASAPALLAACEEAASLIEGILNQQMGVGMEREAVILDEMRDTIAAARGEVQP